MSIKQLPGAPEGRLCAGVSSQLMPKALNHWDAGVQAAKTDDDRTISIYDVIGHDYWTGEGVTAKRIAGALRAIGSGAVTVNINSPGGDMFEGLAIYNLLREHKGEVTVKVLGVAASAASIIAMAGDKVQIAKSAFLMIHNAWVVAAGNRNDLREFADRLEPFDSAMAQIYQARIGGDVADITKMMNEETWINGGDAIDQGFADELIPSDAVKKESTEKNASAVRRVESALRASGLPKSEAMKLISELKAGAGDPVGSGEGDPTEPSLTADLSQTAALAETLTKLIGV